MSIIKVRVVADTEEDIFRDIEIEATDTFERLHKSILAAFDFNEGEMSGTFVTYPERESVPENIREQLIVELYSK